MSHNYLIIAWISAQNQTNKQDDTKYDTTATSGVKDNRQLFSQGLDVY